MHPRAHQDHVVRVQTPEADEAGAAEEMDKWPVFAARLRADIRARLPDPQALVAAYSALTSRGAAKPPPAEPTDEEMPETLDEGDAAAAGEEVSRRATSTCLHAHLQQPRKFWPGLIPALPPLPCPALCPADGRRQHRR